MNLDPKIRIPSGASLRGMAMNVQFSNRPSRSLFQDLGNFRAIPCRSIDASLTGFLFSIIRHLFISLLITASSRSSAVPTSLVASLGRLSFVTECTNDERNILRPLTVSINAVSPCVLRNMRRPSQSFVFG